jgi:hypothetical protein
VIFAKVEFSWGFVLSRTVSHAWLFASFGEGLLSKFVVKIVPLR